MTRELHLIFEVDEDCTLTWQELNDLGDRIVSEIEPDPPVLTYQGSKIEEGDPRW